MKFQRTPGNDGKIEEYTDKIDEKNKNQKASHKYPCHHSCLVGGVSWILHRVCWALCNRTQ